MSLILDNPASVAPPLGRYSQVVEVPAGAGLLYLAGQVGVTRDGRTGATLAEQADIAYDNIVRILAARGRKPDSIIKLTVFLVEDDPENATAAMRAKHLGEHRPASTAVYVRQLFNPAWKIEIEAVALAG